MYCIINLVPMKLNRSIITFTLFLLLVGCAQNRNMQDSRVVTITQFPQTKVLCHEKIPTPPVLYSPVGLLLLDSAAVVLDLKADTLFQVFKRPSFTYIGGFIHRGEGPEEEFFVDPFMQRLANNRFMFRNLTGTKFMEYDGATDSIRVTSDVKLSNELTSLFHTFVLDNLIVGVRADEATKKEFVAYNPQTCIVVDFGEDFPIVEGNIDITGNDKIQLFAKANTVKPDGTAFACVYDKFPIMRIYSNTGEIKSDIRLKNGQSFPYALIKKTPTAEEVGEMMQNYRMIKSTNRFIYALYIGKRNNELSQGFNDFSDIIHVWDWEGNPIIELKLDKKIFTFDVSSDNGFLLCSSLLQMDGFYKYKLPNL